jgi:hypothetical protein
MLKLTFVAWLALVVTLPDLVATSTAKAGSGANGAGNAASENLPPAHPVTPAQVYEILKLTGTDTLKREMLDGLLPHVKQAMPYMPADVVDDLRRSLGTADFEGAMVRSFQQHLSAEDAAEIIAFYQTPAGKRMIAVMPNILDEGREAGSELGQQVTIEVVERHRDEIDAASKSYREQHPAAVPQQ